MEKQTQKRILCGTSVGFANSLFGGGGGMLAVPTLKNTGLGEKQAHATAILVILPVSLFSFLWYVFGGWCDMSVLIPTSLGVTVGGLLGAKILGNITGKKTQTVFAFLQLFAGLWMLFA